MQAYCMKYSAKKETKDAKAGIMTDKQCTNLSIRGVEPWIL
jgi:hypothetical protein